MAWAHRFFSGRLSRQNYVYCIFFLGFLFLLGYSLMIFIPLILHVNDIPPLIYIFGYFLLAVIIFISYSLYVRRMHDLGWSGTMVFLGLIPVISTVLGLLLLATPGDEKENKYGIPQKSDSFDLLAIFLPKYPKKDQQ